MMGNKLADEVVLFRLRQLVASTPITASVFATQRRQALTESPAGGTGTAHSTNSCTTKWKMSLDVVQTSTEYLYTSTTSRSNSNCTCLICYGSHAMTRLGLPSKKMPVHWVFSNPSRLQDLRFSSSLEMLTRRCHMSRQNSISDGLDGSKRALNNQFSIQEAV